MDTLLIGAVCALLGLLVGYLFGGRGTSYLRESNAFLQEQLATAQTNVGSHSSVVQLVTDLKTDISNLRTAAATAETARGASIGEIKGQLTQFSETYTSISDSTRTIASALSRGPARGKWGEMQLEVMLEHAGLLKGVHFERQKTVQIDGQRITPDITLNLPDGTKLHIDSKFPFDAYWRAIETDDEAEAQQHLAQHAKDVLAHAADLKKKGYADSADGPSLVVLFMPLDSIFFAALEADAQLQQKCFEQSVALVCPSLLLGTLRSVTFGWQRNELAINAQKISDTARSLLTRLAKLVENINKLGGALTTATTAYNDFTKALDNSVLSDARKIRDLGVSVATPLSGPKEVTKPLNPYLGRVSEIA